MLALCAACAADPGLGDTLAEPQPLVFSAVQGGVTTTFTRAATNGTWDGGEQVAIQIGAEVKKYKVADVSTGALKPFDSDNTFYRTDKSAIDYTAWYPYSDEEPDAPTIVNNQSTTTAQESCNLMTARGTAAYGETATIQLQFSHEAARIRLHVNKEGTTTPLTDATVQFSIDGKIYTAHNDGEGYYSILVAPETKVTEGAASFVRISTNNVSYEGKAPADATFEAGKSYDYHFDLKRSLVHTSISVTWPSAVPSTASEVIVKYGNATLTAGTDYELSYSKDGHVCTVTITGKGIYTGSIQKEYETDNIPYLTFTASSAQGFKMTIGSSFTGGAFEYSVGNGAWTTVTSGEEVAFGGNNGTLRLRGVSSVGTTTQTAYSYSPCKISFTGNVSVAASGDIRTLVNYKHYDTAETNNARFRDLFSGCAALTSAPALPAETLADYCYYGMFNGCTGLKTAPVLPAETLAYQCYREMFNGCTALTSAPKLPAETLASQCYYGMFKGCKNLQTAPELPATTLASRCYHYMFSGCKNLQTAPELPATTLASYCYFGMFSGCTNLTTAPKLPATTLVDYCYQYMFSGCTKLDNVTIYATGPFPLPSYALYDWLKDVASNGTIYCTEAFYNTLKGLSEANSILPSDWTRGDLPN